MTKMMSRIEFINAFNIIRSAFDSCKKHEFKGQFVPYHVYELFTEKQWVLYYIIDFTDTFIQSDTFEKYEYHYVLFRRVKHLDWVVPNYFNSMDNKHSSIDREINGKVNYYDLQGLAQMLERPFSFYKIKHKNNLLELITILRLMKCYIDHPKGRSYLQGINGLCEGLVYDYIRQKGTPYHKAYFIMYLDSSIHTDLFPDLIQFFEETIIDNVVIYHDKHEPHQIFDEAVKDLKLPFNRDYFMNNLIDCLTMIYNDECLLRL